MDYFDLGSYYRPVSTTSPEAQTWFNRGLIWCYGFNHEEAVKCFDRAIDADPNCGLAYFGLAYALGPNYNKPWEAFGPGEAGSNLTKARDAINSAKGRMVDSNSNEVERALVHALQSRYEGKGEERSSWNVEFAQSMEEVYGHFSDDLDVAAIYADALMNLTPWDMWDLRTGKPTKGSRTLEAKAVLEKGMALEGGSQHPGLLHLYIHLMEMSQTPEAALPAADELRGLVPDAGHLHHMPTHLDVLCGDYRRVVTSNSDAIKADKRWLARDAGALNFYSVYRMHNFHFRIYGAMFAGVFKVAIDTVAQLEESLSDELVWKMPTWLEGFFPMRVHVLVRFGRWDDILRLELPKDTELYCVTTAMTLYARSVALANTDQVKEAEAEKDKFLHAVGEVPASRTLFNNTCRDLLAVASAMLDGEIDYRCGDVENAFTNLRKAIELSDNLPYDEPWGWMQPPRHAYGALLLEQGRVEEAMAVYSADLGLDETLPRALQHPNNIWALHGYHECLIKSGRASEAGFVKKQLDVVTATADVTVMASCFCRSSGVAQQSAQRSGHTVPWRFNDENR
jgi:tetratricopeptide (TPR) repeat protein